MTAPWAVVELDPERVAAELARRFPGVSAWRGEYTGRWWAVARDWVGRDRLVEAGTPAALVRVLCEIGAGCPPVRAASAQGRAPSRVGEPWRPVAARDERTRRSGWFRRMVGVLSAA
ncbi:hypothetical protein [Actinomadura violacea]|uniref:Uncharacterized protein n=1 Tax=Actinomadura violacea TaxID=2819934 RepID=A0ABS3S7Z5_9ACTN|nr:hypothetical protein [Actinomadura violacea]MBO2464693.1 hypothetical protein [Actinomadura violacea]